ncbi:hypothetical protein C8Q72DRAFT_85656 [Fomitopsis betulina]|nr:hypothetical protein C8Q72DRAFT_85656 [Fomitopsis betulina]
MPASERILPASDLQSFAQTCRWFREIAIQPLYRGTKMFVYAPTRITESGRFIPPSLWLHIRFLFLYDLCYMGFQENLRSGLCRFYEPLGDRLRELPNVRSLTIYSDHPVRPSHIHGLPWNTVHSILSVPHLREFILKKIHICPSLRPGEEIHVGSLAPMTSFHYQHHHPRDHWSFPLEIAALATILESLCGTLETLALMTESAPLSTIAKLD